MTVQGRSDDTGSASPREAASPGLAGWALGTAIVALVVAVTSPVWAPAFGSDPLPARVAALESGLERVAVSEREIERVARSVGERVEPLAARLAAQEQDLQRLAKTTDQRIDDMRRLALIGAVAQLRPAVARPTPFPMELAAVVGLAGDRRDLAPVLSLLVPHAAVGIPTLRQVRARFDDHAMRALLAEASTDDVPIVSQLFTWISATAPLGSGQFLLDLTMPAAATAVRNAGRRLEADDLDGAVATLATLKDGPAAEAMRPWLEQARARRDAGRAIDQLSRAALAAAPGGR